MSRFDAGRRRSWLFVPADSERKMDKALQSDADIVIFDLEDGVSASRKAEAREAIIALKRRYSRLPKPLFVRINPQTSDDYEADLLLVRSIEADGILLPKSESAEQVRRTAEQVRCELVPMIETALGLQRIHEMASSSSQVSHLTFGSLDFSLDMNIDLLPGGPEMHYIRFMIALASRVANLNAPIDTVYPDFRDTAGLEQENERTTRLGFAGKLLIHPQQIEPTNRLFSPTDEQLNWADRVIHAFERAIADGKGAIQLEGEMIDAPVYQRAKKMEPFLAERSKRST